LHRERRNHGCSIGRRRKIRPLSPQQTTDQPSISASRHSYIRPRSGARPMDKIWTRRWISMPSPRLIAPYRLAALIFVFGSILFTGSSRAAVPSAEVVTASSTVTANLVPWMTQQLSAYAGTQYGPLVDGVWTDSTPVPCWACANGGPATAAATLYVLGGESNPALLNEAKQTINSAIAHQQTPDGGFTPPSGDSQSEAIASVFFGVEFGTTYYLLAPYLDDSTKSAWQASLAQLGNYMVNSGSSTWYINGNINLGITELFWLTWQATGQIQFLQDYNNSWAFTTNPPQNKFPGAGWVTTKTSTQADGSDGAGYFAEVGADSTGYDAEYTMLQVDVAARLWLLSGDPRALDAANMLINQELPQINTTTWMLNTSNGTRHTDADRQVGWQTGAFAVLGLDAGRTDLIPDIMPALRQGEAWFPQPDQANSPAFRRAFGNSISLLALAAANNTPTLQSTVSGLDLATEGAASDGTTTVTDGGVPVVTTTATGTEGVTGAPSPIGGTAGTTPTAPVAQPASATTATEATTTTPVVVAVRSGVAAAATASSTKRSAPGRERSTKNTCPRGGRRCRRDRRQQRKSTPATKAIDHHRRRSTDLRDRQPATRRATTRERPVSERLRSHVLPSPHPPRRRPV
jgi:hypothetical protein